MQALDKSLRVLIFNADGKNIDGGYVEIGSKQYKERELSRPVKNI